MSIIKVLLIVIVGLFFNASINASPTSNEFIPCKKTAVAVLKHCLEDDKKNCWSKSKTGYESCAKKIFKSHDPKEQDARKKAEIKARAEIEKQEKEK